MKHLARAPVMATFAIEERTDLSFALALARVPLAFAFAFASLAALALPLLLGSLSRLDDRLLVAVGAALAVRARLSVADVEAGKLRFLFGRSS